MINLEIIGRLTHDPETGTTESGVNWCRFKVAARKKYHKEGEPDAEFIRVTAWRGLADSCAKYLGKGRRVYVRGDVKSHAWTGQDGNAKSQVEMNADDVEFLDSSGGANNAPTDADAPPARGADAAEEPKDPETGMTQVETDELPF